MRLRLASSRLGLTAAPSRAINLAGGVTCVAGGQNKGPVPRIKEAERLAATTTNQDRKKTG